jgi:diaminohydroxyphosphoribosylaminopyrimidine deaminase / 5-amino-6-(5-phosphoribosylamino)uracil reductase
MSLTPAGATALDQNEAMLAPLVNAERSRPFVVAQLGQSLDGRIATPTGESRWINKDCALDHVHRIRANVDAVVVGVGTVVADDPLLNVRRVPGRNPARVVIDPKGRVPVAARCLDGADGCRRVVIRAEGVVAPALPQGVEIVIVPSDANGRLDPRATVAALHARGLRTMLIEGGAWTVSEFINARAVDRLHVLVAPVILGLGKPGLSLVPIDRLSEALRPVTRIFPLADGDVLFDCDLRT